MITMATVKETIDNLLSKKLIVTLSEKPYTLHIIDWPSMVEEHEDLMEKTEDLSDEEVGEFLCDNESKLMQITEYFMNDACDKKVEEDKWLPFGLLGLAPDPISYAETKHDGLLLLDISKVKQNAPPVILFKKGKSQVVAPSIEVLDIRMV
jgi:hypothetical protein